MKHSTDLNTMIAIAKQNGLKRLKVGTLEVELSDYELVQIYTNKQLAAENLTGANNAIKPSPSQDASPQSTEDDDEALLFHSSGI